MKPNLKNQDYDEAIRQGVNDIALALNEKLSYSKKKK